MMYWKLKFQDWKKIDTCSHFVKNEFGSKCKHCGVGVEFLVKLYDRSLK